MWLCVCSGRQFEETFEMHSGEKSHKWNGCDLSFNQACNLRTNLSLHLLRLTAWRDTSKLTLDTNHTNTAYVTLCLFKLAVWGNIWKLTQEKSRANATNVSLHLLGHAIWGPFWELTVVKNHTNATNATIHLLKKAVWGYIWKLTPVKNHTNATSVNLHLLGWAIWEDMQQSTIDNNLILLCIPFYNLRIWGDRGKLSHLILCSLIRKIDWEAPEGPFPWVNGHFPTPFTIFSYSIPLVSSEQNIAGGTLLGNWGNIERDSQKSVSFCFALSFQNAYRRTMMMNLGAVLVQARVFTDITRRLWHMGLCSDSWKTIVVMLI